MKKSIYILITILVTFTLPMLTSWLFDWWWISDNWTREALVSLLMLAEFVIGIFVLKTIVLSKSE